jgi:hypothetical protein
MNLRHNPLSLPHPTHLKLGYWMKTRFKFQSTSRKDRVPIKDFYLNGTSTPPIHQVGQHKVQIDNWNQDALLVNLGESVVFFLKKINGVSFLEFWHISYLIGKSHTNSSKNTSQKKWYHQLSKEKKSFYSLFVH